MYELRVVEVLKSFLRVEERKGISIASTEE